MRSTSAPTHTLYLTPSRLNRLCSWDTLGNAWWGRKMVEEMDLPKSVTVVTNEFHMDRSIYAFRWAFGVDDDGGDTDVGEGGSAR